MDQWGKGHRPQKIPETDKVGGGPSTGWENSGRRLASLKDSLLVPKPRKYMEDWQGPGRSCYESRPALYIPEGILFLSAPTNLAPILLPRMCPWNSFLSTPQEPIFSHNNKEQLLIHTLAWVNLKITMLSERSQTKQSTCYVFPFV